MDNELEEIRKKKMEQYKEKYMNGDKNMSENMPDKPITMSDADIDQHIQKYDTVVIDCWAPWCGPCRMIHPIVEELAEEMKGKVVRVGDDVNTDYIISGRFKFKTLNNKELASHLFEDLDPSFSKKIREGDILVAGKNFGSGSSREQAPLAIKYSAIAIVIASSFSRIFFRNGINIGLPLIECETKGIEEGDILEINFEEGKLFDTTKHMCRNFKRLPPIMQRIIEKGGLVNYLREHKGFS